MSDAAGQLLLLLLDWSIRFGVLILILAGWFWFRPPQSIATRVLLGRLVLLAGLLLPLAPRWLSISWPAPRTSMRAPEDVRNLPMASQATASPSLAQPTIDLPDSLSGKTVDDRVAVRESPVVKNSVPDSANAHGFNEPASAFRIDVLACLAGIWATGVLILLTRLGAGLWWLGRITSNARTPAPKLLEEWHQIRSELGVKRDARLMISSEVATPVLLGGSRPVVVLPIDWESVSPAERRAAFLHEWTHIQHLDDWWLRLDELTRAFLFFHPFVLWLVRRIRLDCELRCDAQAIRHGIEPREMAVILYQQIKRLGDFHPRQTLAPVLSFLQIHSVKERIQKLLQADRHIWPQPLSRFRQSAATLVIFGLMFGLGGLGNRIPIAVLAAAPIPENQATVTATGKVFLANGKPAAGAIVFAACPETISAIRLRVITNQAGEFRLPLPKGKWWISAAQGTQGGEPHLPSDCFGKLEILPPQDPKPLIISMEERGLVKGKFVEKDKGKPIPNAQVYLGNGYLAITDQEGQWEAPGLTRAGQSLVVRAAGHLPTWFQFDTSGKVVTELFLEVKSGNRIFGKVTDDKGRPVPGACVGQMISQNSLCCQAGMVPCDSNGNFEYWVGNSAMSLTAQAPGSHTQQKSSIVFVPGKPNQIVFQLKSAPAESVLDNDDAQEPKHWVQGNIKLPDGSAAKGIYVRWGLVAHTKTVFGITDDNGNFKLKVSNEEAHLAIIPRHFTPQFIQVPKNNEKKIDVQLLVGRHVAGIVLDEEGKPIAGARVLPSTDRVALWENSATTDRNGRFELDGIAEHATFSVFNEGFVERSHLQLASGKPDQKLVLTRMGLIKGKLVGGDGKPVRNFRVTLNGGGATNASYTGIGLWFTSDDGAFVISGFQPGSVWNVRAFANGHGRASARIEAVPWKDLEKAQPTVVTAKSPASLNIRLRDPEGGAIRGAKVTLVDGNPELDKQFYWANYNHGWENMISDRSNSQGIVDFSKLSIDEATVLVEAAGFARQRFGWRKGGTQFAVALKKEAVLFGKVAIPSDWKDHVWYYELTSEKGDIIREVIHDKPDGVFVVRELTDGKWKLEVGPLPPIEAPFVPPNVVIPTPLIASFDVKPGEFKQWKGEWKP